MNVLAAHVHECLWLFTGKQLPVLLWAFARKNPSAAAVAVMEKLVDKAALAVKGIWDEMQMDSTEKAVCMWATNRLTAAKLIR